MADVTDSYANVTITPYSPGSYENFLDASYVKHDYYNCLTVDANSVNVVDMQWCPAPAPGENIRKDFGASYFGNFDIKFKITLNAMDVATVGAMILTNDATITSYEGNGAQEYFDGVALAYWRVVGPPATVYWNLADRNTGGGNAAYNLTENPPFGVPYWVRLQRTLTPPTSVITAKFYTTDQYAANWTGTPVHTSTLNTLTSSRYQYLILVTNRGNCGGGVTYNISYLLENMQQLGG